MATEKLSRTAIQPLVEGYEQFRRQHFTEQNTLYQDLVEYGQKPKVLIIACCDSRVDPAIVTGAKPGELFVVRSVANLVPPFESDHHQHGTSAAIEYAVKHLGVEDIIIFGHSHCGGIQALLDLPDDDQSTDFIGKWMRIAKKAKLQTLEACQTCSNEEKARHCEKQSLQVSLENLLTFPWIKSRVDEGTLCLHGWYFDLNSGNILHWNDSWDKVADYA